MIELLWLLWPIYDKNGRITRISSYDEIMIWLWLYEKSDKIWLLAPDLPDMPDMPDRMTFADATPPQDCKNRQYMLSIWVTTTTTVVLIPKKKRW
jgi:hypothetical protein